MSLIKMRRFLIDYARKRKKLEATVDLDGLPEGIMAGRNRLESGVVVDRLLDELEKESPRTCGILVARMYLGHEVQKRPQKSSA